MITKTLKSEACCGSAAIYFITDRTLDEELLTKFKSFGFKEMPKFAQQGIFYVFNDEYSLSGQIGNCRLQLTCIKSGCENNVKILDSIL